MQEGHETAASSRGLWTTLGDPGSVGPLSELGFDWIALDAQHGRWTDETMQAALAARRNPACAVHVRVRSLDAGLIGRALDAGADGIIVPLVDTGAGARAAVDAALYPPLGRRSWGPFLGAYDRRVPDTAEANSRVRLSVMIETADGLRSAAAIAATPGVDGLFVGPFDLAIALGMPLDELLADTAPDSPLSTVVSAASAAGVAAGAFGGTPERAALLAERGFSFVAVATDTLLFERGARSALGD